MIKRFKAIDTLYWEMVERADYYADSPDVSGECNITENVKTLLNHLTDKLQRNAVPDEIYRQVDFDLSDVTCCAQLYGEEKGFILGFIHGVKYQTELCAGMDLIGKSR